jgi:hypothetical protein
VFQAFHNRPKIRPISNSLSERKQAVPIPATLESNLRHLFPALPSSPMKSSDLSKTAPISLFVTSWNTELARRIQKPALTTRQPSGVFAEMQLLPKMARLGAWSLHVVGSAVPLMGEISDLTLHLCDGLHSPRNGSSIFMRLYLPV